MGKGSLGEVLPAAVRARFAAAIADRASEDPPPRLERAAVAPVPVDDFGSLA